MVRQLRTRKALDQAYDSLSLIRVTPLGRGVTSDIAVFDDENGNERVVTEVA
jgi:hypothetical protein